MWVLYIAASFASLFAVASGYAGYASREYPLDVTQTAAQAARYRNFAYAASLWVKSNPVATGSITADVIMSSPQVPPSMKVMLPADWKIVADGTGKYVLCGNIPTSPKVGMSQFAKGNSVYLYEYDMPTPGGIECD
jgi:hypothetical protein